MQDSGAIRIELDTVDGFISSASIRSSRPVGLARLFLGRSPREAPELSRRLFTLCSRAQGAAASEAIAQASGEPRPEATRRLEAIGVLAERAFESMRSGLLGWPWEPGDAAVLRKAGAPLREAASAAQTLAGARESDLADPEKLAGALAGLTRAARTLGIGENDAPEPDAVFAALLRQCEGVATFNLSTPDALTALDDASVAEALESDPEGFAARPALPRRRPETGAYARHWPAAPADCDGLAARLIARLADVRHTLAAIGELISRKDIGSEQAIVGGRTLSGAGYGAVECARGRLYHLARVGGDGRIAAYGILAPTDWNFHPAGPCVAALVGARIGRGAAARSAAAKLAALLDPCVAFDVEVREFADA